MQVWTSAKLVPKLEGFDGLVPIDAGVPPIEGEKKRVGKELNRNSFASQNDTSQAMGKEDFGVKKKRWTS